MPWWNGRIDLMTQRDNWLMACTDTKCIWMDVWHATFTSQGSSGIGRTRSWFHQPWNLTLNPVSSQRRKAWLKSSGGFNWCLWHRLNPELVLIRAVVQLNILRAVHQRSQLWPQLFCLLLHWNLGWGKWHGKNQRDSTLCGECPVIKVLSTLLVSIRDRVSQHTLAC